MAIYHGRKERITLYKSKQTVEACEAAFKTLMTITIEVGTYFSSMKQPTRLVKTAHVVTGSEIQTWH